MSFLFAWFRLRMDVPCGTGCVGRIPSVMTVSAVPEERYERLLLRDHQPRGASWDGRWVYELEPEGSGTRLKITEYGWTDGFPFFISQRVLANPDAFLIYYARMIGRTLNDTPEIQVLRSH